MLGRREGMAVAIASAVVVAVPVCERAGRAQDGALLRPGEGTAPAVVLRDVACESAHRLVAEAVVLVRLLGRPHDVLRLDADKAEQPGELLLGPSAEILVTEQVVGGCVLKSGHPPVQDCHSQPDSRSPSPSCRRAEQAKPRGSRTRWTMRTSTPG